MIKFLSILVLLLLPLGVLAQITFQNPLEADTFEELIDNVIDFLFNIALVLVPLMLIIGGFLFVTAGGNISQIDQAKRLIGWTVVGLIIVLLAKGLVDLLLEILEAK